LIKVFGHYFAVRKAVFILGEGVLIFCAAALASYALMHEETYLRFMLEDNWWKILLVTVITQVSLYFNDLYEIRIGGNRIDLATRLIRAIGITAVVLAIIYFLWPDAMIGRWIFFLSIIFLILFFVSWRLLYSYVVHNRLFSEKALILGDGELAKDLLQEIKRRRDISYDIRYVVGQENVGYSRGNLEGTPVKYGFESLCDLAEAEGVSNIIVALDQKRGVMPYNELLNCKVRGINVIDGESFYERISGKLLVEKINPSWLIFSDGFKKSAIARLVKRIVGLILSIIMAIFLSPLFLVAAVAIKLDSKGPVFFKQARVGENGEIYTVFKFRSMREDAEA
jgi:FlaA1/EpsC-like NDP-sugar epimerase